MDLVVGDMVGTTNRFKWAGTFDPITDMVGGRPFLLRPGQWTDDTSVALCIADFLLAQGHYDLFDVMGCYQCWLSEGYRSPADECFDTGGQVRAVLFDLEHDPCVSVTAGRATSTNNGAVMHLAPVMIAGFRLRSPREVVTTARLSAHKTHFSVEAEIAIGVFAALLAGVLLGWFPGQLMDVSWASTGQPFDEVAARVIGPDPRVRTPWEAETSGYIVNGPRLAVYGLLDLSSFKDVTLAIANMGGDSDTNTATYGWLGDTFYGIEAVPASWGECVYREEEIDELACILVDLQLEAPVTRLDEDLQGEVSPA